jgi:hypothetical protein
MPINGWTEFGNNFQVCFITGMLDIRIKCIDLYKKSRMMGDYHVRFCERLGVKLPLSTRHKPLGNIPHIKKIRLNSFANDQRKID